ncbi:MAG: asparaginase domain-containing protein [Oscillospiraceae bacterium]
MKVLVLSTGGTIGSTLRSGIIFSDAKNIAPVLLEKYNEKYKNDIEFDFRSIDNILSENITDDFYNTLFNQLIKMGLNGYDGIVILHGSDTISYTSSLAAIALRHITAPVAFVCSNLILSDERSNGLFNFHMAIEYFKQGGKGFVVPYINSDGRAFIHLATRIREADSITNDFISIGELPLAEYIDEEFVFTKSPRLPTKMELAQPKAAIFMKEVNFSNKILLIKCYPSIDYSVYDFSKNKPSAILQIAYHSGTASCANDEANLPNFIENCKKQDIDFYIASVKRTNETYETSEQIKKSGAIELYNLTIESALARLKVAYNQQKYNPEIITTQTLYFERI